MLSLAGAKITLLEEMALDNVNILRVRELCRDNPGLIASAGLRIRIWTLLLLGELRTDEDSEIPEPSNSCLEQNVLDADVKRTRADIDLFRSVGWRKTLTDMLQTFCISHDVQYKQGMNEIMAPFLFLTPPPKGNLLPYRLFEAFLFRYLERYFCQDDSSFLFKAFRLLHILLMFHDPQLAWHLHDQDFPPELYAPQWLMTSYSRGLPLPLVLRLWDILISVDDPSFTFFIGLCLLRRRRTEILMSGVDGIPEIIASMQLIQDEEEVDALVTEALQFYHRTPRCFLRCLRLCCVTTPELAPTPTSSHSHSTPSSSSCAGQTTPSSIVATGKRYDKKSLNGKSGANKAWADQELIMAEQAARSCLLLSPNELISSLCPISSSHYFISKPHTSNSSSSSSSEDGSVTASGKDVTPPEKQRLSSDDMKQYVLIDIRSSEESSLSGGGVLARAIQLEPDFLNEPDALDGWMQHFDGTRGCSICIIDMPKVQSTGVALWRRLLLGEGDGIIPSNQTYASSWMSSSQNPSQSHAATASGHSRYRSQPQRRDSQSSFASTETAAQLDDETRPAVKLAMALQRNNFPSVSVLDGGFPVLVRQLESSRGAVEPVILDHDPERWRDFLRATGRLSSANAANGHVASHANDKLVSPLSIISPNAAPMEEAAKSKVAMQVAMRLGHTHMAAMLRIRLQSLGVTVSPLPNSNITPNSMDGEN